MANEQALFTIQGTASTDVNGDRVYEAVHSEVLNITLEANPSVALSAEFEVFDPTDSESPFSSKDAPDLTWNENSLASITVGLVPFGVNDTVTITMPVAGTPNIHSYIIRCTVSTAGDGSPLSQKQVFERMVVIPSLITTPAIRKTTPAETTQARARAWSDSYNDVADAIENASGGGAVTSVTSSDTDLLTVVPVTGAVVLTPVNQEINTTAQSTYYGVSAGVPATDGAVQNVGFGEGTLASSAGGRVDNSVAIGYNALNAAAGDEGNDANDNTAVGHLAGASLVIGDNNLLLGSSVDVPAATTSNYINIGNTLVGNRSTAQWRIGTSQAVITGDASLQLAATNQALALNVLANDAAVPTPINGMLAYMTDAGALRAYESGAWTTLSGAQSQVRAGFAVSSTTASLGLAQIYACTDTTAIRTLTFSTVTIALGSTAKAFLFTVKDENGNAGTNTLTIATEGAQTIDGAATATITTDFGSVRLYSDGSNLFTG